MYIYSHGFFHDFLIGSFDMLGCIFLSDFFENFNDFMCNFIKIDIFIIKYTDFIYIIFLHLF